MSRICSSKVPAWYQVVGACGFVLVAVQWMMTDLLSLRIVAVLSSLAFVVYNLYAVRPPLRLPIIANFVFISINLFQMVRIVWDRSHLELESHELALWETLFHKFLSQRQMRLLLRLGELEHANEGDALPHGRDASGKLSLALLVDGFASVMVAGKHVATLGRADFVGEMSFLDDSLPSHAQVVALEPITYIKWDGDELRSFFAQDKHAEHALQALWNVQLVRRLGRMDERVRLRSRASERGLVIADRASPRENDRERRAHTERVLMQTLAATSEEKGQPSTALSVDAAEQGTQPHLPWYMRVCLWYHRL